MSWNDVRRQNEALSDALTFKQYKKLTSIENIVNYRDRFTAALKISKSLKIRRLAEHGLDLCDRAERQDQIEKAAEQPDTRLIWHGHLALVVNS